MKEYNGIPASPGIAIQHAFTRFDEDSSVPRYTIGENDIVYEMGRFTRAIDRAAREIKSIKSALNPAYIEQRQLLDAQLLMLFDPDMNERVKEKLPETLHNVEWILTDYIEEMVNLLESSGDEYLAGRSLDILDVSRRITNHLLYRRRMSLSELEEEIILITPNLLPSETALLDPEKVRGIAMDAGGRTTHMAILARSFGIPVVLGLRNISRLVKNGDLVIIDGDRGRVLVEPDEETLLLYRSKLLEQVKREEKLSELRDLPAETSDGRQIALLANIEIPDEIDAVKSCNAEGIGLFRSEFLFMNPGDQPDEESQYEAYRRVLEAMEGKPVTIRTLDVGGDKNLPMTGGTEENNPLLGWRAIRFCLEEQELFRTQLRALLRASVHGDLKVMFPLISGIGELESALAMLEEERADLIANNVPVAKSMPVGIMVEVPSAALTADVLATRSDFFSIGTNDLIQHTMAVDRGNEKIAALYQPYHPAVWRLIQMTVDSAKKAGIPVGMCGEVAGDPASAVLLLAMGLDELSMGAYSLANIKHIIRSVTAKDATEALEVVLTKVSHDEVEDYMLEWLGERFDEFKD